MGHSKVYSGSYAPGFIAGTLLATGVLASLALGLAAWWRAPVPSPSLSCPDGGVVQLGPDGVASCAPGAKLPAGQALTLGQKFDCNAATAQDLGLAPGLDVAVLVPFAVLAHAAGHRPAP